ncbi:hypothetical protein D3C79_920250 [compost metagenome]
MPANVQEGAFQLGATDFTFAGDEAGGVVTGGLDDLVVAERRRYVGGGVSGGGNSAHDCVGGNDEAGGAGGACQAQHQSGANQMFTGHDRGLLGGFC